MVLDACYEGDVAVLTRAIHSALARLVEIVHVLSEALFQGLPPGLSSLVEAGRLVVARLFSQVIVSK